MKKVSINTNKTNWVSQQVLANELKVKVQCVHNWIKRKKIDSKYFPELNMTLVDRTSISARAYNKETIK